MGDLRGGSGYWCPDCGTTLAMGQVVCHVCGLNIQSDTARSVERANGELHQIQDQLDALTAQKARWLNYRAQVLAAVPRVLAPGAPSGVQSDVPREVPSDVQSDVQSDGASAGPAAPRTADSPTAAPPTAAPITAAPPPIAASAAFAAPSPSAAVSAGAADPFLTQATAIAQGQYAARAANAGWSPEAARRPARTLSAAALLGVSGAALFILAGIVFVAASWSTYGPGSRMAILFAFAATFAWLAVTSTKHDFATVGGALGVVSAAFVGVSVYALTAGPSGPAPFTLAVASLLAGLAGLGLSRLGIGGVGGAAAGAFVFAVESGAFEAALRATSVTAGLALYAIVAAAGGSILIATRSLWTSSIQQGIAMYGGVGVAFLGAAFSLFAPLQARGVEASPFVALTASALACAGIAAWRPLWGGGVLTGLVTLGAMSAASMWSLGAAQLSFVGAIAVLAAVAGLSWAPNAWRAPGLAGILPALGLMGPVAVSVLTDEFTAALVGGQDSGVPVFDGGGGLVWFGVALVIVSAIPLVTWRWSPPVLATMKWPESLATAVFAAGTLSLGVGLAAIVANGPAAGGVGLALAATVQWVAAPMWRLRLVLAVRKAAVVFLGLAGIHGAATVLLHPSGGVASWWGSAAIGMSLVGLGLASIRIPQAAGAWAFVALNATAVWSWQASGEYGIVLVAVAVAAVAIALAARWLPRDFAMPVMTGSALAYVASFAALIVGAAAATANSLSTHPTSLVPAFAWAPMLSACAALAGPIIATLVTRVQSGAGDAVTRVVSSAGFLGLALTSLAWLQQAISMAPDVAPTLVDSISPALAVAAGGLAFALVVVVPWWRSARWPVGVGVVALVTAHALFGLGRLAFDTVNVSWTVAAVSVVAIGLGIAARWVARVTVAPAVLVASLMASAALAAHHPEQALAAGAGAVALVAWAARWARGEVRASVLIGGSGVALVASGAVFVAIATSLSALGRVYDGEKVTWEPWQVLATFAATGAVLAWPPARRVAGAVAALALVIAAGLVPSPIGWMVLAATGLVCAELAARWRTALGLHPYVSFGIGLAAVMWSGGSTANVAVTLGALSVAALWTAVRASDHADGAVLSVSLVLAPLAGSIAAGMALASAGVSPHTSATIAAGVALTMPLVAVAVRLDKDRSVAVGILGTASVAGPIATLDLALAGLVILMACAAWFTLSTLGVRWARWVALGGLSAATMLLAAAVGIATVEAYTAVPAASMVVVGLWWMRRDPAIRTYFALAPGLGLALVPSYVALLVNPDAVTRPLALMGGAVILAAVGVLLEWFAPLLATAVTTVVVAVSQLTVADSLAPVWANVAVIGAVLFGLAILAERIKAMR